MADPEPHSILPRRGTLAAVDPAAVIILQVRRLLRGLPPVRENIPGVAEHAVRNVKLGVRIKECKERTLQSSDPVRDHDQIPGPHGNRVDRIAGNIRYKPAVRRINGIRLIDLKGSCHQRRKRVDPDKGDVRADPNPLDTRLLLRRLVQPVSAAAKSQISDIFERIRKLQLLQHAAFIERLVINTPKRLREGHLRDTRPRACAVADHLGPFLYFIGSALPVRILDQFLPVL